MMPLPPTTRTAITLPRSADTSSTMEWQAVEDDSVASDTIRYSNAEYSKSLLKGLNDLREKAVLCDVILRVDGQTFPAHRCVLAIFSPYFSAMFNSDMKESRDREVTLQDIEPDILQSLLEFFYTGTICITKTNVQSLVAAANLLQVLSVRDACSRFMAKHMDASNCLGIRCLAETMNCEKLQEMAKGFALSNFQELAEHEEFLNLPLAKLIELVSSDALEVLREEDVFTTVLKWFNYQPEARKDDFYKVLECVRLPLMSPYFLHNSVSKQEVVRTSFECRDLLQEALSYHVLPGQRGNMESARTRPRRTGQVVDVIVCAGGSEAYLTPSILQAFDPVSNHWASLCELPSAVRGCGAALTEQNVLYMAGGYTENGYYSNRLLKFDPQTNKWEEMARMGYARSELGMAALDGFLYAVGGYQNGIMLLKSVERYNIEANKWEQMPTLRTATINATVFAHGGYLYVAGGQKNNDAGYMERFDPRIREWEDMEPMPVRRQGFAYCVLDGKLYIIGGKKNTVPTNEVECYDVRTKKLSTCAPMRARRNRPGVAVMGGHIYVLGGEDDRGNRLFSVERYTPATGRWEDVFEMTMASSRYMASYATLKVRKSLLPSGNQ